MFVLRVLSLEDECVPLSQILLSAVHPIGRIIVGVFAPSMFDNTSMQIAIAMICVTKSRTGNYDFRACARGRDFPGSTRFGRTLTLRRVCRAITR